MGISLVTGGAGFIGSHLVDRLAERGEEVRVLDDLSTGRRENLAGALATGRVRLQVADLRNPGAVARSAQGCDTVYHLGAIPSVQRSVEDPLGTHEVNVNGTLHVLVAARDARVGRVVFASSSSIYGNRPGLPKPEEDPLDPLSPYGLHKLAAERHTALFTALYGLETVALRFFNVFGPRQDPASEYAAVVPRFATRMMRGEPPTIFGDGLQSRDFTYVSNVVDALQAAARAEGVAGEAFNVACGRRHTLLDLVATLNRILGTSIQAEHGPARVGEVRHSQADIEKARARLGFAPAVDLAEGLARTVEAFCVRAR
ncbi:MAG: SDR family oxidoreductase [Planctomycetes bacterium]|nr:SDR family oxidoreductase [Planctomycetota bacterium]